MAETLGALLKISLVNFSLLWCFVLGPAVAYGLTRVILLAPSQAMGLILIGLTPCAPFLPMMVEGLSVTAWMIAKPLFSVVLLPLVIGMVILRCAPAFAAWAQAVVKKVTGVATIVMLALGVPLQTVVAFVAARAFAGRAEGASALGQARA